MASNIKNEKLIYKIDGISCASCALKIEERLIQLSEISDADVNLMNNRLIIFISKYNEKLEKKIKKIVEEIEPGMEIKNPQFANLKEYQFSLKNLSCASCAEKIETQLSKLSEVSTVNINFTTNTLKIKAQENPIDKIKEIVDKIEEGVQVIEKEKIISETKNSETAGFFSQNKKRIINLVFGTVIFISTILYANLAFVTNYGFYVETVEILLYLAAYLLIGRSVLQRAAKNIINGFWFDEYFLMSIATIGAIAIGEYPEAVSVMLFYRIGDLLQDKAVDNSRKSIKDLMDIQPDYVNLYQDDQINKVSPQEVNVGDIILVKAGEKVPLDGKVTKGESVLDTSALTGESELKRVSQGDEIKSGVINKEGLLYIKVNSLYEDSTVAKILKLVEESSEKKAKTEKFITRFAKVYTPIIVVLSALLTIIPVLFFNGTFSVWLYRSLIFLVISCPCALLISIPLGYFGGIGRASKNGILVKGSNYLEALRNIDTIVFDKSGTLTEGKLAVQEVKAFADYSKEQLMELAAGVESFSNHPIARAINEYFEGEAQINNISEFQEMAGMGITAKIDEEKVVIGNEKLLDKEKIEKLAENNDKDLIYIALDGNIIGTIKLAEKIKESSFEAMEKLKNIKKVMLTGDNEEKAKVVAEKLKIDKYYHSMMPADKVNVLEEIIESNKDGRVAFVGDGINDAPVLARSDIGIAMGGLGTDAAIEASDLVIMNDNLEKIATALDTSVLTNRIVWQNIILALSVKAAVLTLGAFGLASMWSAVFADVGVALLAVFNSTRIIK